MADIIIAGSNRYLLPGSFTNADILTFSGTGGRDTLFAGGNAAEARFVATAGNDLYGVADDPDGPWPGAIIDYTNARCAISVDLTRSAGMRTFVDEHGTTRTVEITGIATGDGFGGVDLFARHPASFVTGSAVDSVLGSRFGDTIVTSWAANGGDGNDRLTGHNLGGEAGNDRLFGTADYDAMLGGTGHDKLFGRGGDDWLGGESGRDFVDGGAGDDYVAGGVGKDVVVSGAGNDLINPDNDIYYYEPVKGTDGARDEIRVTRADIGAWRDTVMLDTFEVGRDEIRFREAVRGGIEFSVTHAESSTPGRVDTILQIDSDGDGLGGGTPDADDYFLTVAGADLSLHGGYLLE